MGSLQKELDELEESEANEVTDEEDISDDSSCISEEDNESVG